MIILKCDSCKSKFRHDYKQLGWPDECPHCGYDFRLPETDEVFAPRILHDPNKTGDRLFRAMEAGAEQRIERASEEYGIPKEDLSSLKITNMKDKTRPGEDSAIEPQVSPAMQQAMANPAYGFTQNGLGYSGPVASGPEPNAGARIQKVVRQSHARGLHSGQHMSDIPANEVMSPGYRRRV